MASELCPSRLLTTAIGTPAASMRLAVAQVVESNGAQPGRVGEFTESFGDGLGVQR